MGVKGVLLRFVLFLSAVLSIFYVPNLYVMGNKVMVTQCNKDLPVYLIVMALQKSHIIS